MQRDLAGCEVESQAAMAKRLALGLARYTG